MKVSLIIPCYNAEHFIIECLNSVEKQTYKDIEVICIDDGSTDQTSTIISNYIPKASIPIQLIEQENKGATSARNNGLRYANGEYIQFLDADDLLKPNKIARQIEIIKKANFPDIVIGSSISENFEGRLITEKKYSSENEYNPWVGLFTTDLGNTCANIFKASLFKNGIEWNEKMQSSQEYEMMFQILKTNPKLVWDEAVNTIIRVRDTGSISKTNVDKKWERYVQLRVDIYQYLKANHPDLITENMHQLLFDAIRFLYPHNPTLAKHFYRQNLPSNFKPQLSATTSASYLLLFKIFGFNATEKIRKIITNRKAS